MPRMHFSTSARRLSVWLLVALGAAGAIAACSNAPLPLGDMGGFDAGKPGDICAHPNAGCACAVDDQVVDCGRVEKVEGSYVTCAMGKRTCNAGKWGECIGDQITTHSLPASTLGLGGSTVCVNNPCDPDCLNFVDTPSGLDGGNGIKVVDGGVTLEGVVSNGNTICTGLTATPTPVTMTVTSMTGPNTQQFTASLLPNGCYVGPVPALWTVDKFDIAQISTTGLMTLVTPVAGPISVNAYAGTLAAPTIPVTVKVNVVDVSAAPNGYTNPALFVGVGAIDNIEILYPYAGTMLPLGQVAPLPQWRNGGTTANAVKITLRYPAVNPIFSWSEIIPENTTTPATAIAAQPRAPLPQSAWFAFEQSVDRNRGVSGDTGQIVFQRIVGGALRAEKTRDVRFAPGQLKGKIYYNSYGTNLVKNFSPTYGGARFGAATLVVPPGGTAPTVVAGTTTATDGPGCRVCHSVSPNGNILATLDSGYTAVRYDLTVSPLVETTIGASGKYTWPALAPDGSYMFSDASSLPGSGGTKSYLFSLAGVALIAPATSFTNLRAGTPTFRGDGTKVAFNFFGGTAAPLANPPAGVTTGDTRTLSTMDFNPATKVFTNFKNVHIPASGAAMWPSFLPPGQDGIVFEREIIRSSNGGWGFTRSNCDSKDGACNNTGATAELWWVNAAGTAAALANANGVGLPVGPNLHGQAVDASPSGYTANSVTVANYNDPVYNYEPTVLPIQAAGFSWVVFTSRRMYGNVATINPYYSDPRFRDISAQPTPKKIWIAAIANNPVAGTDPSFPAFYVPGQELLAGNSRAYFALDACRAPGPPVPANVCDTDLDCCGGTVNPKTAVCKLDSPIANPPLRHCVAAGGGACSADGASCTLDVNCCNFGAGSRCSNGACAPPPPIVNYVQSTFVREFTAVCAAQKRPIWRWFDWQASTPNGTSISFKAATKEKPADVYGADVAIGAMIPPPNQTVTWTSGPKTVDDALLANAQVSRTMLRVTMTLTPKTTAPTAAPILTNWRQGYDCVDAQ